MTDAPGSTDPDAPSGADGARATGRDAPPRSRRGLLVALIAVAVLLVAAIIAIVVLLVSPGGSGDEPVDPTVTPTVKPTITATPSASASPTPSGPTASIPADCGGLFSPAMVAQIEDAGLALNPAWEQETPWRPEFASVEATEAMASGDVRLACTWVTPGGSSEIGIQTRLVAVTPEQAAALEAAFAASYHPVAESWGTRWTREEAGEYASGESHTIVAGVWFATFWLSWAPDGYTADMVANVVR